MKYYITSRLSGPVALKQWELLVNFCYDSRMYYDPRLLKPSGLNNQFIGEGLSFSSYIAETQKMIRQARLDLSSHENIHQEHIIAANSPFIFEPTKSSSIRRGILLIHGLYDSPFGMRDVGRQLQEQGFLVYGLLLPGHGTVPGDLLNIRYQEWIKAAHYGIKELTKVVDQVYIGGHSTGAILALDQAINNSHIQGLILFAPALKFYGEGIIRLSVWFHLIDWAFNALKWYKRSPLKNYAKYESFCFNAGYQCYRLIQRTRRLLALNPQLPQLFIALSHEDEVIVTKAVYDFFSHYQNPQNRLLVYTKKPLHLPDPRIIERSSYFPEEKILDFAHTSIPNSPENPHYGRQGDYQEFIHYPHSVPPKLGDIYLGSLQPTNLLHHVIQRLNYNPDFYGMMDEIKNALDSTSPLLEFIAH